MSDRSDSPDGPLTQDDVDLLTKAGFINWFMLERWRGPYWPDAFPNSCWVCGIWLPDHTWEASPREADDHTRRWCALCNGIVTKNPPRLVWLIRHLAKSKEIARTKAQLDRSTRLAEKSKNSKGKSMTVDSAERTTHEQAGRIPDRVHWHLASLDDDDYDNAGKYVKVPPEQANLVTSLIDGSDMHAPVLDIDFPARLIPSSTPGHYHLYLDGISLSWPNYARLLTALGEVGVLQKGYVDASLQRGSSTVRVPWVKKPEGKTKA